MDKRFKRCNECLEKDYCENVIDSILTDFGNKVKKMKPDKWCISIIVESKNPILDA